MANILICLSPSENDWGYVMDIKKMCEICEDGVPMADGCQGCSIHVFEPEPGEEKGGWGEIIFSLLIFVALVLILIYY